MNETEKDRVVAAVVDGFVIYRDEPPVIGRAQVIKLIDAFLEFCPDARYSFGHIVLDDLNLSDDYIEFCLKEETIGRWLSHKLSLLDPTAANPKSDKSWERFQYDELIATRNVIEAFLKLLLMIPEEIRDNYEEDDE